jgi:peroxiredoxin
MRIHGMALGWLLAAAGTVAAGEYNEVLSVGDAAPAWENLLGTDGQEHALADLADKDVVVVVFTCNSCPVAVDYEDRIIAFAKEHAGADSSVALVAINCNTIEEDRLPAMQRRAEEKQFPFAYLWDESQQVGRAYGAVFTPEVFVLDRDRNVVYMGALDDNSDASQAKESYLQDAVAATLAGRAPETTETLAHGCRVRYERRRREP